MSFSEGSHGHVSGELFLELEPIHYVVADYLSDTVVTGSVKLSLGFSSMCGNPNGAVRRVSGRVIRYRDADMAIRWTAADYLQAEKSLRRIQSFRDLWVPAAGLGRKKKGVVQETKVA